MGQQRKQTKQKTKPPKQKHTTASSLSPVTVCQNANGPQKGKSLSFESFTCKIGFTNRHTSNLSIFLKSDDASRLLFGPEQIGERLYFADEHSINPRTPKGTILNSEKPIPESLMIAVEPALRVEVQRWWESLENKERDEFLKIANLEPEKIAMPLAIGEKESAEEQNEWYEYVVNQDVRFFFDRSSPRPPDVIHHAVYPIITPISTAAEIEVVSHLLGGSNHHK